MWSKFQAITRQLRSVLIIAPVTTALVIVGNLTGVFNSLEWQIRDEFFRLRPQEAIDSSIIIVTIDEADIQSVGDWPIPDYVLAELIEKIKAQQPRVIGLDLYRDLPEEPGYQDLVDVFNSTPNLIGIEKIISNRVAPPPVLEALGQVGIADLVLDADRTVRRALLTAGDSEGDAVKAGLATQVALKYLEADGIRLEPINAERQTFRLGLSTFVPLTPRDANYLNSALGGYQILMNWRGPEAAFPTVSLQAVLSGQVPEDMMRDRMVLIGSIATSTNDFLETPYSKSRFVNQDSMSGVVVHANIASQLVRGALEGRVNLVGFSGIGQDVWISIWSFLGAAGSWFLAASGREKQHPLKARVLWATLASGAILVGGAYLAFLGGLFVPVVSPLVALSVSVVATTNTCKQKKLENANTKLEATNIQLEGVNRQLSNYSKTLETKVEQRTQQLSEQNDLLNNKIEEQAETAAQLKQLTQELEERVASRTMQLSQALEEIKESQVQLIQSEKMSSLGNLVAGVAHEINNPVGFLKGSIFNAKDYVQDLLEHVFLYQKHYPNPVKSIQENDKEIDLDFLSKDLPKLIESMEGATDRIETISTSLRTFSRADVEHKVSANIHEGLDSTLLILKYRLKANELRPAIKVVKKYADLPTIQCFPGKLNQVFMNILANAIDIFDEAVETSSYAELEDKHQTITVKTGLRNEFNAIEISIKDNGKGMTEDIKARIFDHLFTTKEVGKGTGLGLEIARKIVVEAHNGKIEVESALGEGTEFCIQIPF